MLSAALVEEIANLLGEGNLSQRQIAARLAVSRGIVSAIARGTRGIYGREPDAPKMEGGDPVERCPSCGWRVTQPCVYCRAMNYSRGKLPRRSDCSRHVA